MSFILPDNCNILQVEISAVKLLRYQKIYGEDIVFVTAIKSLTNVFTTSNECLGNAVADELARKAANLNTLLWSI